jgi:hypothetical protein
MSPAGAALPEELESLELLELLDPPPQAASTRALEMARAAKAAVRVRVTLVLL